MAKVSAPANLGDKALTLWKGTTERYDLRPDELRVLEDACRQVDLVDRLEAALVDGELIVRGSQGQPVANPLVQEIRQHRATLQRLLGSLKLPDEDGRQAGRQERLQAGREVRPRQDPVVGRGHQPRDRHHPPSRPPGRGSRPRAQSAPLIRRPPDG